MHSLSSFPIWQFIVLYIPYFGVWSVGLILSFAYWKRQPTAAALALVGILLFFLGVASSICGILASYKMSASHQMNIGSATQGYVYGRLLLDALGFGFLIAAIFAGRSEKGSVATEIA